MAADCLEEDINSSEIEILNVSELHKPQDDDLRASKKVHQFYFVKFWPYKDPEEASKTSAAEKLIEEPDLESIRANKKCKILWSQRRACWTQLTKLRNRPPWISGGMKRQEMVLDYLQAALDKLNSAKIAHKGEANKSAFSTDTRGFTCRMLHGSRSFATESQLIGEIARSKESLGDLLDPRQILQDEISWYSDEGLDRATYTQMLEKIKQIEERKEKALADAVEKGEPWNPFSMRRAILEQIKLVNKISVELRREKGEVELAIKCLAKDDKEMWALVEQRRELYRRKVEARNSILNTRQQFDEMNGWYQEYLSLSRNARELARKKEVEILRKLSHGQVIKFMSRWNDDRTFRINYEISIKHSLDNRQLSGDGRRRSYDDNPFFLKIKKFIRIKNYIQKIKLVLR